MVEPTNEILETMSPATFVWLEITGKCNLQCVHCYADSLPTKGHGALTQTEWENVISEAKELGVRTVQFIGGEPTLHPRFTELVRFAANTGLEIEVYTNLVRVLPWMWSLFAECNVAIATSYYSTESAIHDNITQRRGSQERTLANAREVIIRGLPLRVGIIQVHPDQDVVETEQMLRSLGVENVGVDSVRGIGRGLHHHKPDRPIDALCGGGAHPQSQQSMLMVGFILAFSRAG